MLASLRATTLTSNARSVRSPLRSFTTASPSKHDEGFLQGIETQLQEMQTAGTYKKERIITSPQAASISLSSSQAPASVLNFCANNYLGLSNNKDLIQAAKHALDTRGLGLSSVRFICGTQDIHKELEKKIAKFHNKEDAILYASAFDANAGVFEALMGVDDAIISDELNHASIIDGIRLCKASQKHRFKHMDMNDLREKLKQVQGAKNKMIVTDGVFSMDGDIAPLDKICQLADEYGALVVVDECHTTGFLGKTGRGAAEHCGVLDRVDIINSTLGKALGGSIGGFTTAKAPIIDMLRQRSRPYLFSNTLPPAVVGASLQVFDEISRDTSRRDKLERNTQIFREKMKAAGFEVIGESPIVPIMLHDAKLAGEFAADMLQRGIYVVGFSFPVVPKGKARIRVQLSAAHSDADIDKAVQAFIAVGKEKKVIQ